MTDVEHMYFLTGLFRRGSAVSILGPKGGVMNIDDLINENRVIGTRSQGGKILIKHIMDWPLIMVAFTIDMVAGSKVSHQNT